VFIRGYSLHFFFVSEPVRRSFCEGGWLCGYEVIMQNKANLLDTQMNTTFLLTKHYENKRLLRRPENKPNQTQPVVSLSNLLQTNHPIFQISPKIPHFLPFF
jgi:hypothetical protein